MYRQSESHKSYSHNSYSQQSGSHKSGAHPAARAAVWCGVALASLFTLCMAAIVGVSLWLTPQRVGDMVSRLASEHLEADISLRGLKWDLRNLPYATVTADSVSVVSKVMAMHGGAKPVHEKSQLFDASSLSATLNLWQLLRGRLEVTSLSASRPAVNLITGADGRANWNIMHGHVKMPRLKHIAIKSVHLSAPVTVTYRDARARTDARLSVNGLYLGKTEGGTLPLAVESALSGTVAGYTLPVPVSLGLEGPLDLSRLPRYASTPGMHVSLASIRATLAGEVALGTRPEVTEASLCLSTPNAGSLLAALPKALLPQPVRAITEGADLHAPLDVSAHLEQSWQPASGELPALGMRMNLGSVALTLPAPLKALGRVTDVTLRASARIGGNLPEGGQVCIDTITFKSSAGLNGGASADISGVLGDTLKVNALYLLHADAASLLKAFGTGQGTQLSSDLTLRGNVRTALATAGNLTPLSMSASGTVSTPSVKVSGHGMNLTAGDLSIPYTINASQGGAQAGGDFTIAAGEILMRTAGSSLRLEQPSLRLSAQLRGTPFSPDSWTVKAASQADSIIAADVHHTPLVVAATLPGPFQTVMTMADADFALHIARGEFHAAGYPSSNSFSDFSIAGNLDTLAVKGGRLSIDDCNATLSGRATGVRSFASGNGPAPLHADFDLEFDNVDINHLCARYYEGMTPAGERPDFSVAPLHGYTRGDSLCVAIPRNLDMALHLCSRRAAYMDFAFSPLSCVLSVDNGVARIGDLRIGAPYGAAMLDWIYSTADLGDIHMDLNLDLDRFDIARFMHAFPEYASGPAADIRGLVSLTAGGSFRMFPDMFVNAPSMAAEADLHVDGLEFERADRKVLRITHLMRLGGNGPIRFAPVDAHASIHDNLLQVDPFTVEAGPYKLLLGGANNLNGRMYYHAGLLDSPLHMPFGVNLVGYWRKPKVRFGGKEIHDGRERGIAADLTDHVNVNIMRQLGHGWLQFVAAAAKYGYNHNSDNGGYVIEE